MSDILFFMIFENNQDILRGSILASEDRIIFFALNFIPTYSIIDDIKHERSLGI